MPAQTLQQSLSIHSVDQSKIAVVRSDAIVPPVCTRPSRIFTPPASKIIVALCLSCAQPRFVSRLHAPNSQGGHVALFA